MGDGGWGAFVACDISNHLLQLVAVPVLASLQSLFMSLLCLLDARFDSCSGSIVCFLVL